MEVWVVEYQDARESWSVWDAFVTEYGANEGAAEAMSQNPADTFRIRRYVPEE